MSHKFVKPAASNNEAHGVEIAQIIARPYIKSSQQVVYNSHTLSVVIRGSGFPHHHGVIESIVLSPPLEINNDFLYEVLNETAALLTIVSGEWASLTKGDY